MGIKKKLLLQGYSIYLMPQLYFSLCNHAGVQISILNSVFRGIRKKTCSKAAFREERISIIYTRMHVQKCTCMCVHFFQWPEKKDHSGQQNVFMHVYTCQHQHILCWIFLPSPGRNIQLRQEYLICVCMRHDW